jgi:hypothetical protein
MTSIEAVFEEVAGVVHRCQPSAALFAELSDEESKRIHTAAAQFARAVATYQALSTANIQKRSNRELGAPASPAARASPERKKCCNPVMAVVPAPGPNSTT